MANKPVRAVIAGRVSTTEQAAEGYSIDAQLEKGAKYAELHDWEVVGEYRDAGVSGTLSLGERPQGVRLLRDAKAGKFDVCVWTRLDRFARTVRKALEDFDVLNEHGVEVVFIEEKIDTTTPIGRLFRTVLLAMAAWEVETIRDRNMSGRYEKAKAGEWPSGQPPYGWEVAADGSLRVNDDEAQAVQKVFELRGRGLPLRAIAEALRAAGYRPRLRRDSKTRRPIPAEFGSGAIAMMLARPEYRGEQIVRNISPAHGMPSEMFTFEAPAIVSEVVWDRARDVGLKQRAKLPSGKKGTRLYPLAGRLSHTHSDGTVAAMFGQARRKNGREWRMYRCSASRSNSKLDQPATCDGLGVHSGQRLTSVDADYIEAYTLRWALERLRDTESLVQDIHAADAEAIASVDEADRLKTEVEKLKLTRSRWLRQYAEGYIELAERDDLIVPLSADIDRLEADLRRVEGALSRRDGLALDMGALYDAEIRQGGHDWALEIELPLGSPEWFDWLERAASRSLVQEAYRYPKLADSVLAELEVVVDLLGVSVCVAANEQNPKAPSVTATYEPLRVAEAAVR